MKGIRKAPGPRGATVARAVQALLDKVVAEHKGAEWPSQKYASNPVGFVREVLHERPLPHQVDILNSVRDNFKTAVASGQKTGKTKLVVWLAVWWYCTRTPKPGQMAGVYMLAAIKDQVRGVLWKELRATLRAGAAHGFAIPETVPVDPSTGIQSPDQREIRGLTVKDVEALAGISGESLFICDEASHMPHGIAEAVEGNLIGGGKLIWISNPTRTEGPFYDVFHNPDKGRFWKTFHIDSEAVAKWCHSQGVTIKGVANHDTIREWAEEWGRDHPFFVVRVAGKFLRHEAGRIITLGDIELAQAAWAEAPESGDLSIGVDPAGPGDGGDEWGFCVTRGAKVLAMFVRLGLSEDAGVEYIRGLLSTHRRGAEIPRVMVDSDGPIGSSLWGRLRGIGEALLTKRPGDAFEAWGVKASHYAKREPQMYERVREELWANGARWLREGGAIPTDHKLATELHAPVWLSQVSGKLKVTPKSELREVLGRSPDRADAFLLSVWSPFAREARDVRADEVPAPAYVGAEPQEYRERPEDPYAGGGRGGYDPYAR